MPLKKAFLKTLPPDLDDDVSGSVMPEREMEGMRPREVSGRWTGLYRRTDRGWHLIAVFPCRKEAYHYWNVLSDGKTYRLAAMSGMLKPVSVIR